MKNLSNTFKLTDDGGVKTYLGMNVSKDSNGNITMSQPENIILKKMKMEMGGSNNGTIVQ